MRDRRLSVDRVRERRFGDDIGRGVADHVVVAGLGVAARHSGERVGAGHRERGVEVDAVALHERAEAEIGDRDDAQAEAEVVDERRPAVADDLGQGAVDASEADEGEVVVSHRCLLLSMSCRRRRRADTDPSSARWVSVRACRIGRGYCRNGSSSAGWSAVTVGVKNSAPGSCGPDRGADSVPASTN